MSVSEKALWKKLKRDVAPLGGWVLRVENPIMRGYPDVDYMVAGVAGKVELKVAKVVRGTIRLPHYTVEQHQFALRWTAAGGLCDLLLQAAGVYYWLPGGAAAQAMSPAQAAGQALWWDTGRHVSLAVPLGIRVGGTVKPA